jgi:hypothetical protein
MCRETHPLLFIVHYLFSTDSLVLLFTFVNDIVVIPE